MNILYSNHQILNQAIIKYRYYLKPNINTDYKKMKINKINGFDNLAKITVNEKKTLMKEDRLYILWQAINQTVNIEGEIAEIGVYRGGSSKFILETMRQNRIKNKTMYIFDTFEGMPENFVKEDKRAPGEFKDTNVEEVKKYLSSYENVNIYKGLFEDNCKFIEDRKFSMVHIDVDIYNSAKFCLNFFDSRINVGGLIVIDDFGFETCLGIRKAVKEFLSEIRDNYLFFHLETGQGLFIKK